MVGEQCSKVVGVHKFGDLESMRRDCTSPYVDYLTYNVRWKRLATVWVNGFIQVTRWRAYLGIGIVAEQLDQATLPHLSGSHLRANCPLLLYSVLIITYHSYTEVTKK